MGKPHLAARSPHRPIHYCAARPRNEQRCLASSPAGAQRGRRPWAALACGAQLTVAYEIAPVTLLLGCSSSMRVIITSVVSIRPAMLAAFCRAERVTLVGSTIPALTMSTNSPVLALYPREPD